MDVSPNRNSGFREGPVLYRQDLLPLSSPRKAAEGAESAAKWLSAGPGGDLLRPLLFLPLPVVEFLELLSHRPCAVSLRASRRASSSCIAGAAGTGSSEEKLRP